MPSLRAWRRALAPVAILSWASLVVAHPLVSDKLLRRAEIQIEDVKESYDYIIVGGGQAGIVLASRLSEDPDVTVLVVEYGYFNNAPSVLQPSSATSYQRNVQFNITSVPQTELDGYKQSVFAACCVGGGSTINGMLLNRGSAADYDAWEALGNPGWGWEGLYPYFIKSQTLDEPNPASAEEFNITWGPESYGDGPIHVSFSSFQWPGVKIQRQALIEAGAEAPIDGSGGDAYGVIWYPTALDNSTATRSYAVNGYWDPAKDRPGLNLLTGWRVDEVTFDEDKHATGIVMRQRGVEDAERISVKSNREIVLAAGALHSPQVLQRSGIGPKWLLDEAGIDVLVDLPGVGSNLQDHAVSGVSYQFTTNLELNPQDSMANTTFAQWAAKELAENHAGPLRIATGNIGGLIPFPVIDPEGYEALIEEYLDLDLAPHLPSSYTEENIAGYDAQRTVMADMLGRADNAFLELPLQAAPGYSAVLIKVLSRGTVHLNPEDIYGEPIVDYFTYGMPIDKRIMRRVVKWVRKVHATDAMSELGPKEVSPGEDVVTDEEIDAWLTKSTSCSTAHNSCSNPMMAREHGGVVGPDLLVHGVTGLSVADSSIMPIVPGAHICSTVYAIAEKAADIIKERHGGKAEKPEEPEEEVPEEGEPIEEDPEDDSC
ncbi:hypothetical protein SAPIO_CDS9407 [Scedosporium apiospermum]|uniref:Glucose-methanol-choline oxidoreductase N-terminal domain-containing protein n=1 Tax=Pseudallescheria apiosperma TaxID=563466 RepID=A0A084FWR7_PSEDA|nr:uncharacterized protein SAPIO_CDS9407 [Scedosporium apiospermum]KEZ39529.1 hypothetical protein SAPIO_CDS9407 [Scedosporium apiospermum]